MLMGNQRARQSMTDAHRAELKSQMSVSVGLFAGLMILFGVLGIFALNRLRANPDPDQVLATAIFIGIPFLILLVFLLLNVSRWQRDLAEGQVYVLEGPVQLTRTVTSRGAMYRLTVAERTFVIYQNICDAVADHYPYRVFIAPRTNKVLGVEPLRQ
jgi:hypothetical protein